MKNVLQSEKVTICIPSYNSQATLEKTINSVLRQTYKNYDIFFFDNCSKDNTINIIDYYCNKFKNFKKFITKKNILTEMHFNKILEKKHFFAEFFCIFHSDDIYNKNILNFSVNYLKKNLDCAAVSSTANIIDENDNIFSKTFLTKKIIGKDSLKLDKYLFHDLLFENNNILTCPSFVFRRESFIKNNFKFRYTKYKTASDVDFFLQILDKEKIGIINKELINYRISKYGSSLKNLQLRIKDSDFFLVLKNIINNYKNKKNKKYIIYFKKFKFLLMKDRCRQLINVKLQGLNKRINLGILQNLNIAFYNLKNLRVFLYIILIKFLSIIPFGKFFIKNILFLRTYFKFIA